MRQFLHCNKGYVETPERTAGGWINVECPEQADMLYLVEELKVPASFLQALGDPDERPRFDQEGDWSMAVLRIPHPGPSTGDPFQTVPLGVLSSGDEVVTVCFFRNPLIQDFIHYSQRRELSVGTPADFSLRMLFSATYWFLTYLKQMSDTVTGAEKELSRNIRNSDLLRLMRMQQSLVFFNTSLRGNQLLLERLQRVYGDAYDHDLCDDLEVEMKQADNTVSVYSDILKTTMETYGSVISNNVNMVMKRMTGLTIVLMVPTLVASFYGMNVDGLPLASMPASFYIVVLLALALTLGTYLWLRRIRWF